MFKIIKFFLVITLLLLTWQSIKASTSDNYDIWVDVISGGGGTDQSSSELLQMHSVIGENFVGDITTDEYQINSGMAGINEEEIIRFTLDQKDLNLGTLSTESTAYATHSMRAYTNRQAGYKLYINNDPPISEFGYTIMAIGSYATPAQPGTEQFGINLAANTSPTFGMAPQGGNAIGVAPYTLANYFAYEKGDLIAESTTFSDETVFTVSIIMNISTATIAGHYSVSLDYSLIPNY